MQKKNLFFIAFLVLTGCQVNKNEFTLIVKPKGNYPQKLFINYNNKKDSAEYQRGKYIFTGSVDYPIKAYFSTNTISSTDKNFYIENAPITMSISVEKRHVNDYFVDWIVIDTIIGSNTSNKIYDFQNFQKFHRNDDNFKHLLYKRVEKLIKKNSTQDLSVDILDKVSNDSILTYNQLQLLYSYLDIESQDPLRIKFLKYKIFPEKRVKVGDTLQNFVLPNQKGIMINTEDYKGSVLFIDFWASWCLPCRKQFLELKKIFNENENKNFKILGVSLDEKENIWINTIILEDLPWDNVIDNLKKNERLSEKFGILSIPSNLLIDTNGIIIAKDINIQELSKNLKCLYAL